MSRTRRLWTLVLLAVATLSAACGVPTDSHPRAIDSSQLPERLVAAPTPEPTPTPLITREAFIYLINEQGLVEAVSRNLALPITPSTVLEALFAAPNDDEVSRALSTALPDDVIVVAVDVDTSSDLVTVSLESETFEERLEGEGRQLAVAQLVFTAAEAAGVSQFLLVLNGNLSQLPTDQGESEQNLPVTRNDFASVDLLQQPEPTPEPTDTPTPTPVPVPTLPPGFTINFGNNEDN